MLFRCGGGTPDLNNMQAGSVKQQFPATVGKTYLVQYTHGGGGGAVSSGGTVLSSCQYTDWWSHYVYMAIIKATATTVVMQGSDITIHYLQLD